jgi:hypothetical protein
MFVGDYFEMTSPPDIIPDLNRNFVLTPETSSSPTPTRAGPGKGKVLALPPRSTGLGKGKGWKNVKEVQDSDTDSASDTGESVRNITDS